MPGTLERSRAPLRARLALVPGLCAVALAASGCAARWVDDQGNIHVVGLVAMQIKPAAGGPDHAAQLSVETLGASVIISPPASALTLGYSKDEMRFVEVAPDASPEREDTNDAAIPPS